MVSPKVITITPNRILNTPKVTKITFGELEKTFFGANKGPLLMNKELLLGNNPGLWGNNLGY